MYAFHEGRFGYGWDRDESGRVCHSGSISLGPEDLDLVVRRAEGFQSLISLLAIVESWSHAVNAEERVDDKTWCTPFSSLNGVVRLDMAIDCCSIVS